MSLCFVIVVVPVVVVGVVVVGVAVVAVGFVVACVAYVAGNVCMRTKSH